MTKTSSIYTTSVASRTEKIIYELKIPLPLIDNFRIYKVIPLPTRYNNQFVFIQPPTQYLIINYRKDRFSNLNNEELANCKSLNGKFLCPLTHPLFNTDTDNLQCEDQLLKGNTILPNNCEIKQSKPSTAWIQLSQSNAWLFSSLDKYIVDVVCVENTATYTLTYTVKIELQKNCYLKSKELTIQAVSENSSILINSYVPPLNISHIISNNVANYSSNIAVVRYSSQNE